MSGWSDLAGLVRVRPLETKVAAVEQRRSPFSAGWPDTVQLLAREVTHLKPREVIMEAGFIESQLRIDGLPKMTARPYTETVVLTLVGTPHGDLRYPCASFWTWQDNVRAIALALEALRKVDRYGVTRRGEQYAGWKQLESPDARLRARGRVILAEHGGDRKAALRATHPDHGGSEDDFKALTAAIG